jgi:hypothetical protein
MAVVDILNTGMDAELGGLERARQASVLAVQDLAFDQQASRSSKARS